MVVSTCRFRTLRRPPSSKVTRAFWSYRTVSAAGVKNAVRCRGSSRPLVTSNVLSASPSWSLQEQDVQTSYIEVGA